jgi:hypothetical protein
VTRYKSTTIISPSLADDEDWQFSFLPNSSIAVYASTLESAHLAEIQDQLSKFGDLVDNWDGYGGAAISHEALEHARALINSQLHYCAGLPLPDVSPTSSGTISIEWQDGENEAVVELGSTRVSGFIKPANAQTMLVGGSSDEMSEHLSSLIAAVMSQSSRQSRPLTNISYDLVEDD